MLKGPAFNIPGGGGDPVCPKCNKPMLPTTGGHFCPSCGISDKDVKALSAEVTLPYTDTATPRLGRPVVSDETMALAGKSVFQSELKLAPSPEDQARFDGPPPQPAPAQKPTPQARAPVIVRPPQPPVTGRDAPKPRPPQTPPPAAPAPKPKPREEELGIPRCRSCNGPLDLDEMTEGECRRCAAERIAAEADSRHEERTINLGELVTGLFAMLASLWTATLVLVRIVSSNPDTWNTGQYAVGASRMGLAVFAAAASAAWMGGRRWAAGVALALGPLAAMLTVSGLLRGEFIGDLMGASAWMLAGLAGLATFLAACLPTSAFGPTLSTPPKASARDIVGGVLAFAAAALALWLAVTSLSGPRLAPENTLATVLTITGCVSAILAGVLLLSHPPAGRTHMAALFAAAIAAGVPAWLYLIAGFGTSSKAALGPIVGLGKVLSLEALAELASAPLTGAAVALCAIGVVTGIVLAIVVFARRAGIRGSSFAGFAFTWSLIWTAGCASQMLSR